MGSAAGLSSEELGVQSVSDTNDSITDFHDVHYKDGHIRVELYVTGIGRHVENAEGKKFNE